MYVLYAAWTDVPMCNALRRMGMYKSHDFGAKHFYVLQELKYTFRGHW